MIYSNLKVFLNFPAVQRQTKLIIIIKKKKMCKSAKNSLEIGDEGRTGNEGGGA